MFSCLACIQQFIPDTNLVVGIELCVFTLQIEFAGLRLKYATHHYNNTTYNHTTCRPVYGSISYSYSSLFLHTSTTCSTFKQTHITSQVCILTCKLLCIMYMSLKCLHEISIPNLSIHVLYVSIILNSFINFSMRLLYVSIILKSFIIKAL